ncbi:PucR family transcriptional regulator [Nocardia sp. NBC_00403]|uniref:PucR family transcriptional regulator n=1 Tax=Nocardia sp. NBC_00403 TaxID=2975990 RepID=UPI002E1A6411
MEWERPSDRVRELLRRGAQILLSAPEEWFDEIFQAVLQAPSVGAVADDPVLRDGVRRTNRANILYWAASNAHDPGVPVAANLGEEPMGIARDLVRRGLGESLIDGYRAGQQASWRRWMSIAFDLTSNPDELRELLDVSARSIAAFQDATIAAVAQRIQAERAELTQGSHAERRETVALVLDGAPIARSRAEARLGYGLDGPHTAAVVWSHAPDCDPSQLESVTAELARAAGAPRWLSVVASTATRWVWIPGPVEYVDGSVALRDVPDVRVALGSTDRGLRGFRRSHFEALTTQRMLARLDSSRRLAAYSEVALVALATEDVERADRFVRRTLGELADAEEDIRIAVLTFVREECNAVRAAVRLSTHRNTVLRRLARADQLLPRPLRENCVEVAVALDILGWRGIGS